MPSGSDSGLQWHIPATRRREISSPTCSRIAAIFAASRSAAVAIAPAPTPEKRDE